MSKTNTKVKLSLCDVMWFCTDYYHFRTETILICGSKINTFTQIIIQMESKQLMKANSGNRAGAALKFDLLQRPASKQPNLCARTKSNLFSGVMCSSCYLTLSASRHCTALTFSPANRRPGLANRRLALADL